MTTEQVLAAALDLPDEDRVEIIEALIESIQPADHLPLDDSWRDVIERRSAEIAAGTVEPQAWPLERANLTAEPGSNCYPSVDPLLDPRG